MDRLVKGTWVEIEQTILRPEERSAAVPDDTRATPLLMRVSGFLLENSAAPGDRVRVRTIIGRELSGMLRGATPGYSHSFGSVVPEILTIGTEAEL